MKTKKSILIIGLTGSALAILITGCATQTKTASEKTGSELWGDNCGRCHNSPPISTYSSDQWEVLSMHMKTRTMIPDRDIKKIEEFLKDGAK